MLKKLLAHTSPAVLSLLKLRDPIVDAAVELRESFLLLENRFVREAGDARRSEVRADPIVEVAAAAAEGAVRFAEVFTALVETTKFLWSISNDHVRR